MDGSRASDPAMPADRPKHAGKKNPKKGRNYPKRKGSAADRGAAGGSVTPDPPLHRPAGVPYEEILANEDAAISQSTGGPAGVEPKSESLRALLGRHATRLTQLNDEKYAIDRLSLLRPYTNTLSAALSQAEGKRSGINAAGLDHRNDRIDAFVSDYGELGVRERGNIAARMKPNYAADPLRPDGLPMDYDPLADHLPQRHRLLKDPEALAGSHNATTRTTPGVSVLDDMLHERLMELSLMKMGATAKESRRAGGKSKEEWEEQLTRHREQAAKVKEGDAEAEVAQQEQTEALRRAAEARRRVLGGLPEDIPLDPVAATQREQLDINLCRGDTAFENMDDDEAVLGEGGSRRDVLDSDAPSVPTIARALQRCGACSRREAVTLAARGDVRVNGVIVRDPYHRVSPGDDIRVAGVPGRLRFAPPRLFVYHKPRLISALPFDRSGNDSFMKHAAVLGLEHLIPVAGLSYKDHGLMLLTNDGSLAAYLSSPRTGLQRTYRLRVKPPIGLELAQRLNERGVIIDGRTLPNYIFSVDPKRSKNYVKIKVTHEEMPINELMTRLGRRVVRGGRESFGTFTLSGLPPGSIREVTIPPFYIKHTTALWQPFIEKDWPFFRRRRIEQLRRLAQHRSLSQREAQELDGYSYEAMTAALGEVTHAARERVEQEMAAASAGLEVDSILSGAINGSHEADDQAAGPVEIPHAVLQGLSLGASYDRLPRPPGVPKAQTAEDLALFPEQVKP